MKVFVTGVGGQLGHDVMNELAGRGHAGVGSDIAPAYSGIQDGSAVCSMPYVQLDITDSAAVRRVLEDVRPDAVILAVGSDDLILPIKGIENALTAMDVYKNDFRDLGRSVILLGGGLVGCEAAADYIDRGIETTIVEMKPSLMPEVTGLYRTAVHDFIDQYGGKYEVGATVTEVGKDYVIAEKNGETITLRGDTVVNAMGRRAHATEELEKAVTVPLWKIGDCTKARQIGDAVREGWLAAMEII